jgi:hypothetical protein
MAHGQIRTIIKDWIKASTDILSKNEEQFLKRSLAQNTDPFGTLYLLMKVHNPFFYSRAIISGSESLLQVLGVWADSHLQQFARDRPAYFKSSSDLKIMLDDLVLPLNTYLFTANAVSMYSNIPTLEGTSIQQRACGGPLRRLNNHYDQ